MEQQQLKTDWNQADFKKIKMAIANRFSGESIKFKDERVHPMFSFAAFERLFGLAYTSDPAIYTVCNGDWECDDDPEYKWVMFGITENEDCVGIQWDEFENEKIVKI